MLPGQLVLKGIRAQPGPKGFRVQLVHKDRPERKDRPARLERLVHQDLLAQWGIQAYRAHRGSKDQLAL